MNSKHVWDTWMLACVKRWDRGKWIFSLLNSFTLSMNEFFIIIKTQNHNNNKKPQVMQFNSCCTPAFTILYHFSYIAVVWFVVVVGIVFFRKGNQEFLNLICYVHFSPALLLLPVSFFIQFISVFVIAFRFGGGYVSSSSPFARTFHQWQTFDWALNFCQEI